MGVVTSPVKCAGELPNSDSPPSSVEVGAADACGVRSKAASNSLLSGSSGAAASGAVARAVGANLAAQVGGGSVSRPGGAGSSLPGGAGGAVAGQGGSDVVASSCPEWAPCGADAPSGGSSGGLSRTTGAAVGDGASDTSLTAVSYTHLTLPTILRV